MPIRSKPTVSPQQRPARALVASKQEKLEGADDAQLEAAGSREERKALKLADTRMHEYLRPEGLWNDGLNSGYREWSGH